MQQALQITRDLAPELFDPAHPSQHGSLEVIHALRHVPQQRMQPLFRFLLRETPWLDEANSILIPDGRPSVSEYAVREGEGRAGPRRPTKSDPWSIPGESFVQLLERASRGRPGERSVERERWRWRGRHVSSLVPGWKLRPRERPRQGLVTGFAPEEGSDADGDGDEDEDDGNDGMGMGLGMATGSGSGLDAGAGSEGLPEGLRKEFARYRF
ncbi:uncharacterized protein K452DRAFT_81458 [Aplosporella prunicola CBS 121167]|uniref:Uncharacterized protein n=1 Tax=Aplosporella prunicola CBS 121167 TaxID=1176127 RepID=A0A6A6B4M9_9PEZI|nr:uncharacterized protein K452DRAFT_81458 [Aplosporella prunicola CBS 121167]KAF2139149.1 hypothetical protein K452DRAFT_81458 [Aplosporella prunicola CBS 121167]